LADPPVKLNISAKIIGLIACILAALGLLGYLFAIPAVLLIGTAETVLGVPVGTHAGILAVALLGLGIGVVAALLELIGGYRMYQENHEGKKLLIYGIALGALGSVVYGIGFGGIGGVIVGLVIDFIVYYIVVISRFSNEAPLVAGGGPPTSPPAPGPKQQLGAGPAHRRTRVEQCPGPRFVFRGIHRHPIELSTDRHLVARDKSPARCRAADRARHRAFS